MNPHEATSTLQLVCQKTSRDYIEGSRTYSVDVTVAIERRDCRVLVVEDDDDTREALEELLDNAGYDVLAAANGAVALSLLRGATRSPRPPCDVVILDLMMPVMNGWDFRAKQRADPRLAGIPVLLMSAGGHLAAVSDELQAADHISKPVEVPDLLNKIARLRL